MEMHQLLYVSQAARNIPASDLDDILAVGRANNLARDLSGILVHVDGGFLQILEGERDAVMAKYGRIAEDQRHSHPRVLVDRAITALDQRPMVDQGKLSACRAHIAKELAADLQRVGDLVDRDNPHDAWRSLTKADLRYGGLAAAEIDQLEQRIGARR